MDIHPEVMGHRAVAAVNPPAVGDLPAVDLLAVGLPVVGVLLVVVPRAADLRAADLRAVTARPVADLLAVMVRLAVLLPVAVVTDLRSMRRRAAHLPTAAEALRRRLINRGRLRPAVVVPASKRRKRSALVGTP